jgi:hypothetical protein
VRRIEVRQEHYYNAALERLAEAKRLKIAGEGTSPLSAYLCGLSVECILRSLIPAEAEFYDRHDFITLARLGALTVANQSSAGSLGSTLSELTALWRNSLRFYSRSLFDSFCRQRAKALGLHVRRGTRPAALVCGRLFAASEATILECEHLWLK